MRMTALTNLVKFAAKWDIMLSLVAAAIIWMIARDWFIDTLVIIFIFAVGVVGILVVISFRTFKSILGALGRVICRSGLKKSIEVKENRLGIVYYISCLLFSTTILSVCKLELSEIGRRGADVLEVISKCYVHQCNIGDRFVFGKLKFFGFEKGRFLITNGFSTVQVSYSVNKLGCTTRVSATQGVVFMSIDNGRSQLPNEKGTEPNCF